MTLEDIQAFVAVVETGSLQRAAVHLNLTQPAITRRVQRLERSLKIALLDRNQRPARPTAEGRIAYQRCLTILNAAAMLRMGVSGEALPAGPLRIGASYGVAETAFRIALEAVRKVRPGLALALSAATSRILREEVEDGRRDAAVVLARKDRKLEGAFRVWDVGVETVAVVAPRDWPFPEELQLADIADRPWVINPEGCGFRTQLDRAILGRGRLAAVAVETWGAPLQLSLIAGGAGLGLVPVRLVLESPHRADVRILDVKDFKPELAVFVIAHAGAFAPAVEALAAGLRFTFGAASQHALGEAAPPA